MSCLEVLSPGVRSLIQDCGRPMHKSLGIPLGGAFDGYSYRWANHLLGNAANRPTIEIDIGLAKFKILKPVRVAITGAQSRVLVDGEVAASWSVLRLSPGQTLSLQPARRGLRSYLAIENGFDVTCQLDSASTDPLLGIGGTSANGHPLIKGERLSQQNGRASSRTAEQSSTKDKTPQRVSSRFALNYLLQTHSASESDCVRLEIVPCYQVDKFSEATLKAFTEQEFEVSKDSNRMGIRLLGTCLYDNYSTATQIVSEGVVPGAVQIMPNGLPTILGVDAQTIGGYPKIGVLPMVSRWTLGQLASGTKVRFEWTSWQQSKRHSDQWRRFFRY
ncbi:5-oxoprolinase subunit C family protein [Vibrio ulleungensis]|uniref:Biotin-dependent carboxyltransferase family protein n=1 Tax=Vibrio ulleungensis TaxID=2807619 RepID=A0ABS2HDL6_9VIBR|nr:biotin-dependent carboxyltransferase family protein [Vibrio ulleungensis]MBM7035685.1 biotin-dependent carboxyltransferase family protein [Vibrio ulleungensis]